MVNPLPACLNRLDQACVQPATDKPGLLTQEIGHIVAYLLQRQILGLRSGGKTNDDYMVFRKVHDFPRIDYQASAGCSGEYYR